MARITIKLRVCNQDVVFSINPEQEAQIRESAKTINNEFARCKERYEGIEDAKLMTYLLLQTQIRAQASPATETGHHPFWARFSRLFKK